MIAPQVQIEPFTSSTPVRCQHEQCYEHNAKFVLPQTTQLPNGLYLSCGVHLARFAERAIALDVCDRLVPSASAIVVVPCADERPRCNHKKCDGRKAAWSIPRVLGSIFQPCNVHLPHLVSVSRPLGQAVIRFPQPRDHREHRVYA